MNQWETGGLNESLTRFMMFENKYWNQKIDYFKSWSLLRLLPENAILDGTRLSLWFFSSGNIDGWAWTISGLVIRWENLSRITANCWFSLLCLVIVRNDSEENIYNFQFLRTLMIPLFPLQLSKETLNTL